MSVRPSQFHGTSGYQGDDVYNGYFCWRWFERDAEKFRVLTIEQKEIFFRPRTPFDGGA